MPLVYSVESYLSLIADSYSLYIRSLRELYESLVIHSFLNFLIYYLGEEEELNRKLSSKDAHLGHHYFPFNYCCSNWTMGRSFLRWCKVGVLQYVILKVVLTFITLILEYTHKYGEDLGKKLIFMVSILSNHFY